MSKHGTASSHIFGFSRFASRHPALPSELHQCNEQTVGFAIMAIYVRTYCSLPPGKQLDYGELY